MTDLHMHTTFCDGANTPREMAEAAAALGLEKIGFSGHSYTFFDERYCMSRAGTERYRAAVAALKEAYRGRMEVLLGVEQEYWSAAPTEGYDYVIGSVHFLRFGDVYEPLDDDEQTLRRIAAERFGGDWYALAEAYFALAGDVVRRTGADIIGHFDLITKYNEGGKLFDESHPRYVAAWRRAVDALLPYGRPFEINTGAMARCCRTEPYPAKPIRDYIRAHGGRFILSSDSHSTETLCYRFEEFADEIDG